MFFDAEVFGLGFELVFVGTIADDDELSFWDCLVDLAEGFNEDGKAFFWVNATDIDNGGFIFGNVVFLMNVFWGFAW